MLCQPSPSQVPPPPLYESSDRNEPVHQGENGESHEGISVIRAQAAVTNPSMSLGFVSSDSSSTCLGATFKESAHPITVAMARRENIVNLNFFICLFF